MRISDWSSDVCSSDLNSMSIVASLQFTPDPESVSSYLKLVNYRAGINFQKMPVTINGKDITETRISIGLGMPFLPRELNSYGKFNRGVELGQRGTDDGSLIRERFAIFNVGITYSTRWFIKRQFDS